MPIYEYQCTSCHHHFDLMQKINEKPAHQCPKCFDNSLIKLVSAAGFQLKGTGWYETDFKTKSNKTNETTNKKEDSTKTTETATKVSTTESSPIKSTKGDA